MANFIKGIRLRENSLATEYEQMENLVEAANINNFASLAGNNISINENNVITTKGYIYNETSANLVEVIPYIVKGTKVTGSIKCNAKYSGVKYAFSVDTKQEIAKYIKINNILYFSNFADYIYITNIINESTFQGNSNKQLTTNNTYDVIYEFSGGTVLTDNKANYIGAHAYGLNTIADSSFQHVIGQYNIADTSSLFVIGNGTQDSSRSNAFSINQNGDINFSCDSSLNIHSMTSLLNYIKQLEARIEALEQGGGGGSSQSVVINTNGEMQLISTVDSNNDLDIIGNVDDNGYVTIIGNTEN